MKPFVLILVLIFSIVNISFSQENTTKYNVTGSLIDSSTKKPVAYATVHLADTSGNIISSAYSLENGSFKINFSSGGSYTLKISSANYNDKELVLLVGNETYENSAGIIRLQATAKVLDEVRVTSSKRLVDQKPGMLIYNAENDATNKGGTAADVLRKAPVLNVDAQGNVNMRGSTNLKILVNGKYSGQMARSSADALNMMPADMIKSVEIVTTPSAKYDAEGAAGVINIITKKNKDNMNGALELSASNWDRMFNPRIAYNKNKWGFSFNGHLHNTHEKSDQISNRTSFSNGDVTNILKQDVFKNNKGTHGSLDASINYTIDETSEINLGINGFLGPWPDNSNVNTTVLDPAGNIIDNYTQKIDNQNKGLGLDFNIGYEKNFKREGQKLTLLAQNSPGRDTSYYDARQFNPQNELVYRELNNGKTKNNEWTFQADYAQPLNKRATVTFETGGKLILRNVNNKYDVFASDFDNINNLVFQQDRSDVFKYSQNVGAGYGILKLTLKNNWYAEAGARLEATYIKGDYAVSHQTFKDNFLNFVPTATISKKLDDKNTLNLSYTKRLTRPYIWDLNPNVNSSDPKNLVSGNPELTPEVAHQAEVSYAFNNGRAFFLNTAFYWKQTDNAIIDLMTTNAEGISLTRKENLASNRQYGLNLSLTSNPSERLAANGNFNVGYFDFKSSRQQIFNDGWGADMNVNATWKFPKENFSVQAFGEYTTKKVTLLGTLGNLYSYNFAAKKEFKKARMALTLAAINPFSKIVSQTENRDRPDFRSFVDNRYYFRTLKLTLNWEFGGNLQERKKIKVENDDRGEQGESR